MRRNSLRLLQLVACVVISRSILEAASGTEGAAFLDIPVGAGPAALGSAYSALAQDAYAPIYNPAGLGFVTATQLAGQHLSYLDSINYEFGSIAIPLGKERDKVTQGLGASVQYLGSGNITGTGPNNEAIGDYSAYYAAYSLAYGRQILNGLSLGVTGKVITGKIADVSAHAYAADLGALYKVSDRVDFSATANNLGNKLTFDSQGNSLPMAFHLGLAYHQEKRWLTTVEGVYSKTGLLSGRLGAEWRPLQVLALRAGYKTDTTKELSPVAGVTAGIGLYLFGQEFSYAWLPYGDLGNTQYFSLLLRFGAREDERKNLIEYESIHSRRIVERSPSNRYNHPNGDVYPSPEESKKSDPDYQQLLQLLQQNDVHVTQIPDQNEPPK